MGLVQKLKRKFWYTRMLEGCGRLVKSALLVSNILTLLGGILVLFVGLWTLVDRSFMARLLGSDLYVSSAAILAATGALVICVSFLGCVGAFKEIKCLLLAIQQTLNSPERLRFDPGFGITLTSLSFPLESQAL
ncbi:tetraspanin-11-like [Tropilaelaps mercedesae]|uniref:Tetraspanin-11-like n=1 Tax=Tropilaelaps mercedesae TaxID=418985 RepID=A0A1V9XG65_9ACAR|nr:tetraspanin-11-like [Tropilaelaps mercedesae]